MAMTDAHRVFLQSFISRGILIAGDVRALYHQSNAKFGLESPLSQLAQFVSVINLQIRPMHLEIRKAISEENGSHWYGLVNTAATDITKMASDYSVNELELFKKLIEEVVRSDTGQMSSTDALNLVDKISTDKKQKMSKKEAQDLIVRLRRDRWLVESEGGELSLSTRSLLELDHYIQQQLPDYLVQCNACHRLCLKGQICNKCDTKLHMHCAEIYFKEVTDPKCPNKRCKTPWPHPIPKKVPKESSGASQSTSTQASQSETRKRKR